MYKDMKIRRGDGQIRQDYKDNKYTLYFEIQLISLLNLLRIS